MTHKMINKADLRPKLEIPKLSTTTPEENFQNEILRPILKLQNEVLIGYFRDYAAQYDKNLQTATGTGKRDFVTERLQKDSVLKNTVIGMIVGLLTPSELEVYLKNRRNYNRRITAMAAERITGQI